MPRFPIPNRRDFLQATAAAIAPTILPRAAWGGVESGSPWFLHIESGDSWAVDDPVSWCLENARRPVLGRATEGLLRLTPADGERVIRLVTRRCGLNLIELHDRHVLVHHWGRKGQADLRPFFKAHGIARKDVEVVVRDRKREVITTSTGEDFRFGDRVSAALLGDTYPAKWRRRFEVEPDDWTAAPGSRSGYAWDGVEPGCIPWAALKSVWQRGMAVPCPNCDLPTVLVNFGLPWVGMFQRHPRYIHVCQECRRSFDDDSVSDVSKWMMENLDAEVWPAFELIWDRPVRWQPQS